MKTRAESEERLFSEMRYVDTGARGYKAQSIYVEQMSPSLSDIAAETKVYILWLTD